MTKLRVSPTRPYDNEGEHPCEALIRIVQSREGNPSKIEREAAFVELLEMFRKGIFAISSSVYKKWHQSICQDYESFHHDTVATFIEMVVCDYVPKKYGGAAMFAPYFQSKLYFRTLDRAQRRANLYNRERPMDIIECFDTLSNNNRDDNKQEDYHLLRSVYQSIVGVNSEISEGLETAELQARIKHLRRTAKRVLSDKYYSIWDLHIFSEWTSDEIAKQIGSTRKVVYTFYKRARTAVLAAYAEDHLRGRI